MRIDFDPISVYLVPIKRVEGQSKREAEHQTIKAILDEAVPGHAALTHDPDGRPLIEGASISVSHSANWGAVAIAPENINIGIDIEENRKQASRVLARVLRGPHTNAYLNDSMALTAWTLLEAAFKCARPNHGLALVDFILPSPHCGLDGKEIQMAGQPHRRFEIISSQSLGAGLPYLSLVAEKSVLGAVS